MIAATQTTVKAPPLPYSDHRALYALVRWESAVISNYRRPPRSHITSGPSSQGNTRPARESESRGSEPSNESAQSLCRVALTGEAVGLIGGDPDAGTSPPPEPDPRGSARREKFQGSEFHQTADQNLPRPDGGENQRNHSLVPALRVRPESFPQECCWVIAVFSPGSARG